LEGELLHTEAQLHLGLCLAPAELLPQEKDAQLEEQGQQLSDLQEQLHTMAEDNHQLRDQIRSTRKAMEKSMESKIQEKDAEIAAIGVDNARMVKMAEAEKERMVYQVSLLLPHSVLPSLCHHFLTV
jgi:CHAD domain-containing protein